MAVQALDLMSLHYGFHEFNRPKLILAILAFLHMHAFGLLVLCEGITIRSLKAEISAWGNLQSDAPDYAF